MTFRSFYIDRFGKTAITAETDNDNQTEAQRKYGVISGTGKDNEGNYFT